MSELVVCFFVFCLTWTCLNCSSTRQGVRGSHWPCPSASMKNQCITESKLIEAGNDGNKVGMYNTSGDSGDILEEKAAQCGIESPETSIFDLFLPAVPDVALPHTHPTAAAHQVPSTTSSPHIHDNYSGHNEMDGIQQE
ncbi:hypothetical protein BC830DRAFT_1082172 [Chytriomyces sp. MP71]|nr:hypothetical protein BC830DRAFT_1082172 [Chytriomyces sp. MP71]